MRSQVMTNAWKIYREGGKTWSESLKMAWSDTKIEVTEMISRQFLMHKQSIIDHIISGLIDLSDDEVMREFTKASKGTLISKVENGFLVEFINANVFLSELWIDLANNN